MYSIGSTILYGAQGVCEISAIEHKEIAGQKLPYYVLKPLYDHNATIFVPIQNEKLVGKMREVLSRQEVHQLIEGMPEEDIWIDNDSQRKDCYQKMLMGSKPEDLIRLIKTLYLRQEDQREKGRRLHLADERVFRDAEKLLYDEFALVLNIEREQVVPFILKQIQV